MTLCGHTTGNSPVAVGTGDWTGIRPAVGPHQDSSLLRFCSDLCNHKFIYILYMYILKFLHINDLEDDISSKVFKFADDTKVFRKVTNDTDKQSLQDDLDKLVKWSEKWQMLLNFGKCKCIHIGHGNMDEEYKMGGALLGRTTQEKVLGVTFSADMKVSEQCGIAASKGNQILGLIRRTIMYKEKQLIVPLYKAIVRPHLEYCIQAWRPYRKKDIEKLERIQRRATKIIPELRDLSYKSRLLQCVLTTLETRRLRGDQKVFKIVNGYEDVDRNKFFKLKEGSRTRGHKATLVKEQCSLDMRKYSFSQRVIMCACVRACVCACVCGQWRI